MGPAISNEVILDTLRELREGVTVPLWLFGGVAVDFLAGRWTRPHSDIDLNTFLESRDVLTAQLNRLGYHTTDTGWLTHWWQRKTGRGIEVVFLQRAPDGTAELFIPADATVGVPGRYPLLPGYMDPDRFATLAGVTFRVCSPAGEWLARSMTVVAGRARGPKIEHDLALLETLIAPPELAQLRRRLPKAQS